MKAKDLKSSILQMAVEGKLVPQDPSDEPASALLERIREEKHRLIAEGKAKFPKGGESIIYAASDGSPYEKRVDSKGRVLSDRSIADEVPFELPEGWCWARLENVAWFSGGKTPSTHNKANYKANGILWVTSKDMKRDFIDSTLITLSEKGASNLTVYEPGTILMVTRSGILRRMLPVAMLKKPATINQDQKAICPFDASISLWLLIFLKGCDRFIRHNFSKTGTTVESIVFDKVRSMFLPLPPLAEQRRIAERVAELMPLIDEYGELEDAREALDAALPGRLRRSVLQEAVRGRLAPQDPSDEPASALLGRIRAERRELAAEGKMKLPRGGDSVIFTGSDGRRYEKRVVARGRESEPVCIEDEIPFEIPDSWAWARLGSVAQIAGGGTPDKGNRDYWDGNISWASVKDLKGDYLTDTIDHVSAKGLQSKASISQCIDGDLIVATRLVPGKSILCSCDTTINQDLKRIRSDLDMPYLHLWFQSQRQRFQRLGQGTTVPGIKLSDLTTALIPVPPLLEQRRIVHRFCQLYPFTNQ